MCIRVVNGETASARPVTVGTLNLTQVEILSGLQEGETVALGSTNGAASCATRCAVEVRLLPGKCERSEVAYFDGDWRCLPAGAGNGSALAAMSRELAVARCAVLNQGRADATLADFWTRRCKQDPQRRPRRSICAAASFMPRNGGTTRSSPASRAVQLDAGQQQLSHVAGASLRREGTARVVCGGVQAGEADPRGV